MQQVSVNHQEAEKIDEVEVTSRLLNIIFEMPIHQQMGLLERLDATGYNGSRKQPRNRLKIPWTVLIDPKKEKESYQHYIKNISRCGMFVKTEQTFLVGEKIGLRFQVPSSRKLYKIVGEIVRCDKTGIGVRFKRQLS